MKRALVGVLLLAAGPAAAFVPSVDYPPGVSREPGGGTTFRPTAPTPTTGGRINTGTVGVPTGGGTVRRPITWRIPPGAGRSIASGIIRGGGLGAAAGLATWAAERCVHFKNGGLFLKCDGPEEDYLPGERVYYHPYAHLVDHGSADAACKAAVLAQSGRRDLGHRIQQVDANTWRCYRVEDGRESSLVNVNMTHLCRDRNGEVKWTSPNGKCPLPTPDGQPITEEEAVERLSPTLPPVIPPGVDVPIDQPVWNPSPTAPNKTRPVVAPVGDPVPHTEVTPEGERRTQWTQPNVTITHTPTEEEPMRFEVQPGAQPVTGPNVRPTEVDVRPPRAETQTETQAQPATGGTDGTDGGAPRIEIPDFCETNPEALACVKLGEAEAAELPNRDIALRLQPAPGFEFGVSSCPADRHLSVFGRQIVLTWRPVCDLALGVRPIIISLAGIAAMLTFFGFARRD